MSQPAPQAARDVYEIVTQETSGPKSWLRTAFALVDNVLSMISMGPATQNPGGMILSIRDRATGAEVFRHVEDMGDDDGHLLRGIQQDLETMTATEFATRWAD